MTDGTDKDNKIPELDSKSVEILEALVQEGGDATTTDLRKRTGLNKSKFQYRGKRKLPEMGLIEVESGGVDQKGDRLPNRYTITEEGRRALNEQIEKVESEGDWSSPEDELGEIREEIDLLHNRLDVLDSEGTTKQRGIENRIEEIEKRLRETEERVEMMWEGFLGIREYLRQEHDVKEGELRSYYEDADSGE